MRPASHLVYIFGFLAEGYPGEHSYEIPRLVPGAQAQIDGCVNFPFQNSHAQIRALRKNALDLGSTTSAPHSWNRKQKFLRMAVEREKKS